MQRYDYFLRLIKKGGIAVPPLQGVNWSQLLEVGIDNADDLYWWYVTFTLDTIALNDYD